MHCWFYNLISLIIFHGFLHHQFPMMWSPRCWTNHWLWSLESSILFLFDLKTVLSMPNSATKSIFHLCWNFLQSAMLWSFSPNHITWLYICCTIISHHRFYLKWWHEMLDISVWLLKISRYLKIFELEYLSCHSKVLLKKVISSFLLPVNPLIYWM